LICNSRLEGGRVGGGEDCGEGKCGGWRSAARSRSYLRNSPWVTPTRKEGGRRRRRCHHCFFVFLYYFYILISFCKL
jgi:hypothetical protein